MLRTLGWNLIKDTDAETTVWKLRSDHLVGDSDKEQLKKSRKRKAEDGSSSSSNTHENEVPLVRKPLHKILRSDQGADDF